MATRRQRFVQRRKALGFTQESLAHALGVERTTVVRWESGHTEPHPWVRRKIAAALRITVDQLDDLLTETDSESQMEVDTAKRRAFIAGGLATLSLGLTRSGSAHVTPELAADLQRVSSCLRRAYRTAPAQQLYSSVHDHMQLVLSLRPAEQSYAVRTQMLIATGEMAAVCAVILGLDMGRWPDATAYLDLAQRAATETTNPELTAVVLATRAFHAAYGLHDRKLGLDFAQAAVGVAQQGAGRITSGWVAAVESERLADIGDERASRLALDRARSALDVRPDDRPCSGIGSFDSSKITAYEGGDYRRLGDYDNAIEVLDTALSTLDPSMRRHRATALIDRAEAHHAAGHIDGACADAQAALALVAETQHANTLDRTEKLARSVLLTKTSAADRLWQDVLALKASTSGRPG